MRKGEVLTAKSAGPLQEILADHHCSLEDDSLAKANSCVKE
jgi:hypothetical protein